MYTLVVGPVLYVEGWGVSEEVQGEGLKWGEGGEISSLGRTDDQIKIAKT